MSANSTVALSMTLQEWPLSCLVIRQNRRITWLRSLLLQILHGFHGLQVVFPFVHRWDVSLGVDGQFPVVLVSLAFSSGGRVGLVFQCELIQVSALFFRPPNCHLRFAIRVLFLKSFKNRYALVLLRFSQTQCCLMIIKLFLRLSVSCTREMRLSSRWSKVWQQVKLFFRHQPLLLWG